MTKSGLGASATLALITAVLLVWVSACTSRQVYESSEGWRRQQCNELLDDDERARCMESATTPYDTYKQNVEEDEKRR